MDTMEKFIKRHERKWEISSLQYSCPNTLLFHLKLLIEFVTDGVSQLLVRTTNALELVKKTTLLPSHCFSLFLSANASLRDAILSFSSYSLPRLL